MSAVSNFAPCCSGARSVSFAGTESKSRSRSNLALIQRPFENDKFHVSRLALRRSSRATRDLSVRMALVDETLAQRGNVGKTSELLAYDIVQGALVSHCLNPPTAVFLHGILGSRKNWGTFARRLAQEFPTWQFLLVDLRCHGDSASKKKRGPHTVASTALDVLKLVGQLRITPRVLVGHSFGGKVALSMVEQAAKPLARPVKVWSLDATPGKVRSGGDGEDHPAELNIILKYIARGGYLKAKYSMKKEIKRVSSKRDVVNALIQQGFSKDVAQWVVTNLRPTSSPGSSSSSFSWSFDLKGIAEMYQSYEETNLWEIVEDVPRGVHVNFLKAERSLHRWALEDLQRIHAAEEIAAEEGGGVQMHVLEDAGHWVHADNPDGLFRILSSSFKGVKTQGISSQG
uniref:AB hydrolase-1 domain-containing protein n=1 Tax=Fagus sylvatica TaxID=28930 RepID=A0A2N9J3E3_FAGSY